MMFGVSALIVYDSGVMAALMRVYGEGYKDFLEAIRRPGSRLYARVNTLLISVDEIVERLRSRGVEVYRDEQLAEAIYFPIQGPFQVEELDKRIVVDKYAAESIYMGANVYAPGVISCEGVSKGDEVIVVAEDGTPLANAIAVVDCEDIAVRRVRRGVVAETTRSVYRAPKIRELPEYVNGYLYPQSLPAMYVTHVLDPKPGELVIDTCAAPGGKTSHIIEYTGGRSYVIAFDHSKKRLEEMRENLRRLHEDSLAEIWQADSRYLHIDFSWLKADKIVVDPPCSSLGVRPKIIDRKSYTDVETLSKYQLQFLKSAIKVLKPGGVLVYSTCTVTVEENEEIIEKIAEMEKCIDVVEIPCERCSRGVPGFRYSQMFARFHPHIHDTTGYFIAKIVKRC
ncbi:MAG: RsmB/NOP family class I SAM-dependent RNA methyltransferase [Ignisphaera sp.]